MAAWRGGGLRAWQANAVGAKEFFLYDGNPRIAGLDSTGTVNHAYGYAPADLAMRHYPGTSSIYKVYTFDLNGNPAQRIRQLDTVPQDTAVYDNFGMLHGDIAANTGLPFPKLDAIGPGGQWGPFTDEETRTTTTTGLMLASDGSYYDPSTGIEMSKRRYAGTPGWHVAFSGCASCHPR